jgi:small subunit ribosomal protein S17e
LQTIALSLRIPFKALNPEELFMGIKPSYIKNLGNALLVRQRDYFTKSFEENKQQLGSSAVIDSKRVRNRVAGYITRKMNSKKHT